MGVSFFVCCQSPALTWHPIISFWVVSLFFSGGSHAPNDQACVLVSGSILKGRILGLLCICWCWQKELLKLTARWPIVGHKKSSALIGQFVREAFSSALSFSFYIVPGASHWKRLTQAGWATWPSSLNVCSALLWAESTSTTRQSALGRQC